MHYALASALYVHKVLCRRVSTYRSRLLRRACTANIVGSLHHCRHPCELFHAYWSVLTMQYVSAAEYCNAGSLASYIHSPGGQGHHSQAVFLGDMVSQGIGHKHTAARINRA